MRGRKPAFVACLALVTAACETPPRTVELQSIGEGERYVWPGDSGGSRDDTLFIATASGGGTRASALALGTLQGLDAVSLPGGGRTLLDEVDIISSVSGGSVTAAYFALKGREGFGRLEQDFIRRNGVSELIRRLLNPVTFIRVATPSASRLDVLIDYLEDSLFDDTAYRDLIGRRPYLILNAADMSGGTAFSFAEPQFELICANLVAFELAEAVAASAAFPVVLAPLAIRNYAPCGAQLARAEEFTGAPGGQPRWPPIWIQNAAAMDIEDNANHVRRGRQAFEYLNLDCGSVFDPRQCVPRPEDQRRLWTHLLDGGIADNLGLNEPIRLVSTQEVRTPRFLTRIFDGDIANLVFVVVNARAEADSNLDRSGSTPGIFSMVSAATGSSIDAATFGMFDRLAALIKDLIVLRAEATKFEPFRQNAENLNVYVVPVDFDYIADPTCRRYFKNIATSWTLDDKEITAVMDIGGALLRQSRDFQAVIDLYGAAPAGEPDVAGVCSALLSAPSPAP